MARNLSTGKLSRFTAGKKANTELTAKKFNDMCDMIEANRLQSGVGYTLTHTANGVTMTIYDSDSSSKASKNPFSLYVDSRSEEHCYIAVNPALVNTLVPVIKEADFSDEDGEEEYLGTPIEANPAPTIAIAVNGKYYIYLNFILTEDGTALERAEVSASAGDYYIELGYVEDGVVTSYRSTSLGVHICGDEVNVWAS